jgi:hypothetical protein
MGDYPYSQIAESKKVEDEEKIKCKFCSSINTELIPCNMGASCSLCGGKDTFVHCKDCKCRKNLKEYKEKTVE